MGKFTGVGVSVGFGKETTRGTAVAATSWFARTNMSFEEKFETVVDESVIGTIVDSIGQITTKKFAGGEIVGNLNVNNIALPLLAMLGSVSSAVDTGSAYKHTFSLSNSNQSPSLTISMDDAIQDYRFSLAVIKKMTIKVESGKYVEVSMEFISKKGETATNTPAYAVDYSLKATDTTLKFATNLAGLTGASQLGCIKNFEITLERTISEDMCIGSIDPVDFISTVFAIYGSFEVTYENEADYKTKALAGTTQAMRVTIKDTGTTIGTTSNPSIEIDLAKVGFTEWGRNTGAKEIVTQTLGFKGFYSIADTQAIVVKLINTLSSI